MSRKLTENQNRAIVEQIKYHLSMGVALSDIGKVIHLPDVLVAQVIDRYSIADYKWGHDIHRKEEVVSKPTSTIKN